MSETMHNPKDIMEAIRRTTSRMKPDVKAILFGSRARGDAKPDSDWDILLLINKDRLRPEDYDCISYPLFELGWNLGEQVNPVLYTEKEWQKMHFTPFYHHVTEEGITL